ncbi:hypothetical protein A9K75_09715, partial [Campylobacter fetus subsp. testudinum]|uniref:DUF3310 domain-containing protein n=1 Tax=Campylobacter fetus TaxID=196 RepID=UPI0008187D4C
QALADIKNISVKNYQVGGNHYSKMKIQPIEFINENKINFNLGNVVKYICRYPDKNGVQDLEKALQYVDFEIEYFSKNSKRYKPIKYNRDNFILKNGFNGFQKTVLVGIDLLLGIRMRGVDIILKKLRVCILGEIKRLYEIES